MAKIKKTTMFNVKDFYLGTYEYYFEPYTTLFVKINGELYDLNKDNVISSGKIDYLEPLSNYFNFNDVKEISIKQAKKISSYVISSFVKNNAGKPKRWEPQVLLEETIPYLKVTNGLINEEENSK